MGLSLTHKKVGRRRSGPRILECAHVSLQMCPHACVAARASHTMLPLEKPCSGAQAQVSSRGPGHQWVPLPGVL